MWVVRSGMSEDPLIQAMRVSLASHTSIARTIDSFLSTEPLSLSAIIDNVYNDMAQSDTSRCVTYKEINPRFTAHDDYRQRQGINEFHRLSFTCFRVCAHNLAIETGRWNRRGRGRLPVEERLC